jgi:hypothetical protein
MLCCYSAIFVYTGLCTLMQYAHTAVNNVDDTVTLSTVRKTDRVQTCTCCSERCSCIVVQAYTVHVSVEC